MSQESKATTNHDQIRKWTEERGGKPAVVEDTNQGLLRLKFQDDEKELKEIGWNEFFNKFDENNLALVYQEETDGGEKSRFNKLVDRDSVK